MNKDHFFDEELEELFYEKIEKSLPEKEVEFLRGLYDENWNVPSYKTNMSKIYEDTQKLIKKELLQ